MHKIFLWLFVGIMLLTTCTDCEPLEDPGSFLVVTFYDREIRESDTLLVTKALYPEVLIELSQSDIGVDPASLTLNGSKYFFPVPLAVDTLRYLFPYQDSLINDEGEVTQVRARQDTLSLIVDRTVEVTTPDCGVIENIQLLSFPTSLNSFDTSNIELVVPIIENNDSTNVRIFW